ncbi:uncharacterized protein [Diadema setosum]|uniref:uncharacterized protein n=1 Tax=Diadema setosum TaxID=31175 RepID=UPI003B3A7859
MDFSTDICAIVFLVALLPDAVVSCEGTTTTVQAGQQARITCTFTGDMRNLYWFYQENEEMNWKNVLTYFEHKVTYHEGYTSGHVQLDVETSTLVIMSVSIADEGIYTCDVERINQTPVLNIVSCLDVFATPSKPFPQITECNAIGQEEICNLSFSAETETNITCILSGFYPDGMATLEWLHQDLTPESSVQQDGTYILTIKSIVSREGNYTCEATYVLPNGTATTGRKQVSIKEMEAYNQKVKNVWMIIGPIAAVIVAILTAIIIITIFIRWRKRKRKGTEKEKLSEKYPLVHQGKPGEGTSSPEERTIDTNVSRRQQESVTSEQIFKLSTILPSSNYYELAAFLGFNSLESENIRQKHHLDMKGAVIELLIAWKYENGGLIHDLDKALVDARCGGLVEKYKHYSSSE